MQEAAIPQTTQRPWLAFMHAAALALAAAHALRLWLSDGASSLPHGLHLLLYVHIIFSLIQGRFSGRLAWTWFWMILGFLVWQGIGFLQYIMPFDQLMFAATADPNIGPIVSKFFGNMNQMNISLPVFGMGIMLLLIGLNIGARFPARLEGLDSAARFLAIIAVLVMLTLIGLSLLSGKTESSAPFSLTIVPEWYLLPFYAGLRVIPSKESGVILMFAMLAAPVLAIFITRAKTNAKRIFKGILLALCIASMAALFSLGLEPAESNVIIATQIALVFYFAYFIIGPFITTKNGVAHA